MRERTPHATSFTRKPDCLWKPLHMCRQCIRLIALGYIQIPKFDLQSTVAVLTTLSLRCGTGKQAAGLRSAYAIAACPSFRTDALQCQRPSLLSVVCTH